MKNKKSDITIYVFSNGEKKKYYFSKGKFAFLKRLFWAGILLLIVSLGVNYYFTIRLTDYKKSVAELEDMRSVVGLKTSLLKRADSKLNDLSKKLWNLSLSNKDAYWKGGDPLAREQSNILDDFSYTADRVKLTVGNLSQEVDDLLKIFVDKNSPYQWIPNIKPVEGDIIIPFGEYKDPFTGKKEQHNGILIVSPFGSDIKASASGRIIYIGKDLRKGRIARISHGFGIVTEYGHLGWLKYKVGDKVQKGEVFAKSGNTGKLLEPAVYFEIDYNGEPVNPQDYIIGE